MQFNSYFFLMVFLPILIIIYFVLSKIKPVLGKVCLIIGSAVFYIGGGGQEIVVFFVVV